MSPMSSFRVIVSVCVDPRVRIVLEPAVPSWYILIVPLLPSTPCTINETLAVVPAPSQTPVFKDIRYVEPSDCNVPQFKDLLSCS